MTPVFDALVALGVLFCAAVALTARDRIASVAAFMITSLLISIAWVRLGAPDVALAEAAIGAGLTGALFLRGARRVGPIRDCSASMITNRAAVFLAVVLTGVVAWAFVSASGETVYSALVAEHIDQSGVTNPVTAVLLNFRAWDTLLEIAVLIVALFLVAGLAPATVDPAPLGELVIPFARIVVPLTVLSAGNLLWQGASAPGGAFQAGAMLAGGGLALALCGFLRLGPRLGRTVSWIGLAGLAVFVGAALGSAALTGGFLDYPAGAAKAWIIAIESALTLSIAAILVLLFISPPRRAHR